VEEKLGVWKVAGLQDVGEYEALNGDRLKTQDYSLLIWKRGDEDSFGGQ